MESLYPIDQGRAFATEPEADYLRRVRPLLPAFPDEVLVEWFLRHGVHAHEYAWLGYRGFSFAREVWVTRRILEHVKSWPEEDDPLDGYAESFLAEESIRSGWLGSYMTREGTWPTPPVVLDNRVGFQTPSGTRLGQPFNLLEGHRRAGYLRALARSSKSAVQEQHALWIVTADPEEVMAFRPLNDLAD